jgi:hypothetical protein
MPTAENLTQLQTLLNQLLPIAQTRTGELIRAEDWNTLVGSVMSLARTLLQQEEATEVPAHGHVDQVSADWLVPALRDQLQRGPLADPAMQARLLSIEQQLRALLKQVDGQREDLTGVRGRLADIATRDIVREAAVTDVSRRVSGLGDARGEVLELRKSIGTVQSDMGTVLAAARSLQAGGQPVDVAALVGRVTTLESFRQGFTAASGQVLDAATIEQRLAENRNQFVTQSQLDDALRTRSGTISPDIVAGIEDRVGSSLRTQTAAAFETFADQVRTETQTRLSGVGDLVTSRINDALPGVTTSVTNSLTVTINKAKDDAIAASVEQAAANTAARETALRADLARQTSDIRASFGSTVKDQLAQQLPGALAGVKADVAAIGTKADQLGTIVGTVEATVGRQGEAVAALQQDAGRVRLELRELLQREIKLGTDALAADMASRNTTFQSQMQAQFESLSKDVRQKSVDVAKVAAIEAAQTETRNVRTQILAEMRQVAKEEAGTVLREQAIQNPGRVATPGRVVNDVIINR